MRVSDHLQELRIRLIVVMVWFILSLLCALPLVKPIYRYIVRDAEVKLAILGPADIVWVYFMIAGVIAVAAALPVAGLQLWLYVKPALEAKERRAALTYIPALALLFIAGIAFGYVIVFPMVLSFLKEIAAEDFLAMYTADKYFSFLLNLTVPLGILFEMPVVIMFLTRIGIVNPKRLAKTRKLSYFLLVVASVLITPPDLISDVLVIVPLILLYEISVTLSGFVYRKKLRMEAEAEAA